VKVELEQNLYPIWQHHDAGSACGQSCFIAATFKAANESLMDAWVLIVEEFFPATMCETFHDSCSKARSSIESLLTMFR
jgi:hypothetical protein